MKTEKDFVEFESFINIVYEKIPVRKIETDFSVYANPFEDKHRFEFKYLLKYKRKFDLFGKFTGTQISKE